MHIHPYFLTKLARPSFDFNSSNIRLVCQSSEIPKQQRVESRALNVAKTHKPRLLHPRCGRNCLLCRTIGRTRNGMRNWLEYCVSKFSTDGLAACMNVSSKWNSQNTGKCVKKPWSIELAYWENVSTRKCICMSSHKHQPWEGSDSKYLWAEQYNDLCLTCRFTWTHYALKRVRTLGNKVNEARS